MTVSLKHKFASAKSDGGDATLVKPSNWNDEHDLLMATARLLGRTTAGTGAAEEITVGTGLTLSGGSLTANYTDPVITGAISEDVYTISDGAAFEIDPSNGTMQSVTLGASRTPKATSFANGESIQLRIKDGTAYTVTWTDATFGGSGVIWYDGSAPTLDTTNWTVVVLEKQGGQVYGKYIGTVA